MKLKQQINYMKRSFVFAIIYMLSLGLFAQEQAKQITLFTNVQVFDGRSDQLLKADVLVEGNLIKQISKGPLMVMQTDNVTIIDGGGRTLMPGLTDTHVHLSYTTIDQMSMITGHASYGYVRATVDAEDMLMRGVTSVRDMGGSVFGLKRAIDEGLIPGPRIYPSGALISQTAGHFDFRFGNENPMLYGGGLPDWQYQGHAYLADGVDQVLTAVRENLKRGASQIKIAAGGGYASPADPLLGNQYTFDEIKAAVQTAGDWGTYVTVHSYHPSAINRAIDAGIKDVGHGQLLDKATLERMAKEGVFLSTQPFTVCNEPQLDDFSNAKLAIVCEGTERVYKMIKDIPTLKVTYGTDMFFLPREEAAKQIQQMERLSAWFKPVEILRMATSTAGELFALSGEMRNPYQEGTLGTVSEGGYADLLLVEGNPLEDLGAVTNTDNIKMIMKDGKFYKNTLQ
ncbi:amidohydrolase family protein [Algoriphagus lutimaris]|uniref:metal-dependent hydrolase family protein n=1 Tax=Algoriphagus lutimaris TaxID=613197 RepID=UPI00196B22F3|nr:amidohydrolase family protein [Algoriphagus lutimaris]MBN3522039.1 amidohydrolase family protein [Algoriphagus lutimaris]